MRRAFTGTNAQQVVIPSGCSTIGSDAFRNMKKLMIVNIPDSVTEIGEGAFTGCPKVVLVCESDNAGADYAQDNNIMYMIG